jgi:hypothetical protein
MEAIEKILITPLAILIFISLIFILLTKNITNFEKMFIIIIFISHILLFTSYITNDNVLKDYMHLLYLLSVAIGSIIFTNKNLILLLLIILIVNILFWIMHGSCPMGDLKTEELLIFNEMLKPYINVGMITIFTILIIKYLKY